MSSSFGVFDYNFFLYSISIRFIKQLNFLFVYFERCKSTKILQYRKFKSAF